MKKQSLFVALMAGVMCLFAACNLYTDDPEKKKKTDDGTVSNQVTYSGIVKDWSNNFLSGAVVNVYDSEGAGKKLLATDTTDAQGNYQIDVPHEVDPEAPNAEWKNYFVVSKLLYIQSTFVQKHRPSDLGKTFPLDVYLTQVDHQVTYEGTVKDNMSDTPLSGAVVNVYDGEGAGKQLLATVTTDANGKFKLAVPHKVDSQNPDVEWTNYFEVSKSMYITERFNKKQTPSDLGKTVTLSVIYLSQEIN